MTQRSLVPLAAILAAAAGWLAAAADEAASNAPAAGTGPAPKTFTIGVVRDGPAWYFDALERQIEAELKLLARDAFQPVFRRKDNFNARWDLARIEPTLQAALADPEIDLVLAAGVLVSEAAARPDLELKKPVVSAYAEDAELMGLPIDGRGRSGKTNFSFVTRPLSLNHELQAFRRMVPFKTVAIVADAKLAAAETEVTSRMDAGAKRDGFQVRIVPADETAPAVLAQLGPGVEAVYLTPALRMPPAAWQELIDGLNARKIPTFSMLGAVDVERGVLAGLLPDAYDLLARRVALNLQQIIRGVAPNELPVVLAVDEKLTINARTAIQIDFVCSIELMLKAHVLHPDALEKGERLTLEQAMRIALDNNVNIAIKRAETETSRHEQRKAASQFFPQVAGNAQYQQMNANQAEMSGGLLPEKQTTAGVGISQLIFSDLAFSQYRAAHRQVARMRHEEAANRLDVMAAAGARFLQFLAAKALFQIDAENLRLTQSNLELTRVRFQAGAAGPEEVFRWEAQEARQKSTLIAAEAKVAAALVALNQSLGLEQDRPWKTEALALADDDYYFLDRYLRERINNDRDLRLLESFAVRRALDDSPALKALDQAIAIQAIEVDFLERKGCLPTVGASFGYANILNDEYAGASLQDQLKAAGMPGVLETDRERNEWTATLQASLPLFEGGGRMADVARAKSQLSQLRETRRRAAQWIEQEAHSVLYALQSSHPNIGLSRTAADRAQKNLAVVRKKYAQGAVSILDLLDAQNQALSQDQAAALAVYTYLQDLLQFQRVIAWFECLQSDPEKAKFIAAMEAFWQQAGGATNQP